MFVGKLVRHYLLLPSLLPSKSAYRVVALSRRIDSSYLFLQTDQNLCNSVLLVSNVQQMWCFHPQTVVSPRSNRCWCKIWDENSSIAVENSMLIIMLAYLFILFFFFKKPLCILCSLLFDLWCCQWASHVHKVLNAILAFYH